METIFNYLNPKGIFFQKLAFAIFLYIYSTYICVYAYVHIYLHNFINAL